VSRTAAEQTPRAYALAIMIVLTAINFLNYIDRYVLAAEDVAEAEERAA